MNKYLFLLIVPLLFFSIGCEKDDPDTNQNDDTNQNNPEILIVGHWKTESRKSIYSEYASSNGEEELVQEDMTQQEYPLDVGNGETLEYYASFTEDLQVISTQIFNSQEGTELDTSTQSYSLEGDLLYIHQNPQTQTEWIINELTETNLELQNEYQSNPSVEYVYSEPLEDGLEKEIIDSTMNFIQNVVIFRYSKISEVPVE